MDAMFAKISVIKDELHQTFQDQGKEAQKELVKQTDKIYELKQLVTTMVSSFNLKFQDLNKMDARIGMSDQRFDDLCEDINELRTKSEGLSKWTQETDRHMTKFMPLQFAVLIFESL